MPFIRYTSEYKMLESRLEVSLGRWTVGSIIPNEIDLAKRYKVSRDTMRKALTYLTQQGLLNENRISEPELNQEQEQASS